MSSRVLVISFFWRWGNTGATGSSGSDWSALVGIPPMRKCDALLASIGAFFVLFLVIPRMFGWYGLTDAWTS